MTMPIWDTEAALAHVADLERQLAEAKAETAKAQARLKRHWVDAPDTEDLHNQIAAEKAKTELMASACDAATARADAAEAAAAAMREALDHAKAHIRFGAGYRLSLIDRINAALATTAGQGMTMELDKLRADLAAKDRRIAELEAQVVKFKNELVDTLCVSAKEERDALRARVAELETVLKPFAEWKLYQNDGPDTPLAVRGTETRIAARHVIAARDAMAKGAKP